MYNPIFLFLVNLWTVAVEMRLWRYTEMQTTVLVLLDLSSWLTVLNASLLLK